LFIQGDEPLAATPSFRVVAAPFVGQEVLESSDEKGPEPTALGVGQLDALFFQELGEELLRQVAGVVGIAALTPNVGVNGRPTCGRVFEGFPAPGAAVWAAARTMVQWVVVNWAPEPLRRFRGKTDRSWSATLAAVVRRCKVTSRTVAGLGSVPFLNSSIGASGPEPGKLRWID
jgi:hypothetical protein